MTFMTSTDKEQTMTFYEWMNEKYPDPDTACGELAAYIRDIDALRAAVAYADFMSLLS